MPRIAKYILGVLVLLVCVPLTHAAPPTRVQQISCEASATSTTCTLSSNVTSGDILLWGTSALSGTGVPVITVADNCGGTYTTVDSGTKGGTNNTTAQGYATGSHGACIVTFSATNTPCCVTGS